MVTKQDVMNAAWMYNKYPDEEHLQTLLSRIEKLYLPLPENTCSWCGITDSDNEDDGYGYLTDITVTTAKGEEGWAEELRWVCQKHLEEVTTSLIGLGFGSHRHGGINYLEDDQCLGYIHMDACPTPEVED